MSKKRQSVELLPYQMLKRIQENFCATLGISLAIYDSAGNIAAKEINASEFWKNYIFENPMIYPKCKASEINAIKTCITQKSAYVYPVYCEISSFAVPIIMNGNIIGVCAGGKVRTENPNLRLCKTEAENIKADFDSFLEEYLAIPFMEKERLISISNLLKQIIETVIELNLSKKTSKEKIDEMEIVKDVLQKEIYSKTKNTYEVHKKYESIVENALDVILTINKEGIITEINKAAEEEFGNTRDKIIGNHFSNFIKKENLEEIQKLFKNFINKKIDQIKKIQLKILDTKKRIHHFSVNAKAVYDELGKLSTVQCIMHNISEQKKLEDELKENKDQYTRLFESIQYGVYLSDVKGNIIKANDSLYKIFGYTKKELENIKIWELFAYDEKIKESIERIMEEKSSTVLNAVATNKNKEEFYVEFSITAIKNDKGKIIGHSGMIRDISNRIGYISKAKEEEIKYKTLFDNLREGIIITDEEGFIIEYNKKIFHIFKKEIKLSTNIKDLIDDITDEKIRKLKRKGQIDVEYPARLNGTKESPIIFSVTGVTMKINNRTRFQWILKETCRIDYVRTKQPLEQSKGIPIEKNA